MRTSSEESGARATVTMSETAAQKARTIMTNADLDPDTSGLRLYVQQGGCAGLSYGMRFESEPRETDHVFETNGLRLIVDQASLEHVKESHLSLEDGRQGEGFFVENPNSTAECGCGESFRT